MDGIKEMIGQKVYVILKSGRRYSGIINSFDNNIIFLTDKFDEPVIFNVSEISSMEAEK